MRIRYKEDGAVHDAKIAFDEVGGFGLQFKDVVPGEAGPEVQVFHDPIRGRHKDLDLVRATPEEQAALELLGFYQLATDED